MLKITLEHHTIEQLHNRLPNVVFIYEHSTRMGITRYIQYSTCGTKAYHITGHDTKWDVQRQTVWAIGLSENDLDILKEIGVREDYY